MTINLEKIGIRFSHLSGRILIARFGKDPDVALDTRDAMNEFLHVLVQFVGDGNALDFGGGDEQFTVTLKRKPSEKADEPEDDREAAYTQHGLREEDLP